MEIAKSTAKEALEQLQKVGLDKFDTEKVVKSLTNISEKQMDLTKANKQKIQSL